MKDFRGLPFGLLVALNALFRVPAFLNASASLSDATVVGLQAMHMLRGEWYRFLWGTNYQGSVDSALVALGFLFGGPTPFMLMLVPFIGHLILVGLTYDITRSLGRWIGFWLALPITFTPMAINGVVLFPPRQWSLTCIFFAVWLLHRAARAPKPWLTYGLGAFFAAFALYLDLYVLQLLPAVGAFGLACAWDALRPAHEPPRSELGRRVLALAGGGALGMLVVLVLRKGQLTGSNRLFLAGDRFSHNLNLLLDTCLPWVLGYKVFIPDANLFPYLWQPPAWVAWFQRFGAASMLLGLCFGALLALLRTTPWPVRRLGALGALVVVSTVGGFLVSASPVDMWSARYLAPLVWFAPFALAPVGHWLSTRKLALGLTPYLATAALGGWLSFGPYVHGLLPVQTERGRADEERRFGEFLKQRGIRYGMAQYWLAYRLTFLWQESTIVVPINPSEDRYARYRRELEAAPRFALIFHPSEPRERPDDHEARLRMMGISYERLTLDGFTALVVQRPGAAAP